MHPYLERLERGAAKAEGATVAPLTFADVLKHPKIDFWLDCESHNLQWEDIAKVWQIRKGFLSPVIFESPDESAACAEFLRLTGGGE